MTNFFDTRIEFLKGVGPRKSELLNKELKIFTYGDLIQHYPFRYEDRSHFYKVGELQPDLPMVQIIGVIKGFRQIGKGRKIRLVAKLEDDTGQVELVWFKGVSWVLDKLKQAVPYVVYGKPTLYGRTMNIAHPEVEPVTERSAKSGYLQPVYHSTEKLKNRYLDSRSIIKLQKVLLLQSLNYISETLPVHIRNELGLCMKKEAIVQIHFPKDHSELNKAKFRLKFEELFYVQLKLIKQKITRTEKFKGLLMNDSSLVTAFYENHLPFKLTNAQKRVIKEVYRDFRSGKQMNRLLQGDVGSGKTIVAFACMLIAIGSGTQTALMAPTEILAEQHYHGLSSFAQKMGLRITRLTGSTKQSERKIIHRLLRDGEINILVGTHALLEEIVKFKKLGLAVIDEQHRFGVDQRAKLWNKNRDSYPHVLVMTATPIPRTLAMTLYGDLEVSVIDELPAGRKLIRTNHYYDSSRLKIFGFIRDQIQAGRQIYIVYPLIEESEKSDYKDLMDGFESVNRAFPDLAISILHGRMKSEAKDFEMERFTKGESKIMVATTVIEVGIDVPNASVMVIENAERFGLAQLHQLRGRVGRGAEQSYCILMTSYKLSKEARTRIETMVRTNNGFEIADVDLKLRGPGDLMGTQQSGVLDLLIADLANDGKILQVARNTASKLLEDDPKLEREDNIMVKQQIERSSVHRDNWSRIS